MNGSLSRALALLHLFRRPLSKLFLDGVLLPLGGDQGFRWEGYDDSWVRRRRTPDAVTLREPAALVFQ